MQRAPQSREQLGEGLPPCRTRTHVAAGLGSDNGLSGDEGHGGFLADGGARCTWYSGDSGDEGGSSDIRILFGYCTILLGGIRPLGVCINLQRLGQAMEKVCCPRKYPLPEASFAHIAAWARTSSRHGD
jgi:hypothetical protein